MSDQQQQSDDKSIAQWRVKQLIKSLEAARGNGTSMISLIIPPKDQIARVNKMLGDEFGTASNIKNRVNRLSVLDAITSTQQRLKLYNKVPPNGLVVYCGTIITMEGKEKKVTIDFEPFRPINTSLYLCVAGDAVVATSNGLGRTLADIVSTKLDGELVFGSPAGLSSTSSSTSMTTDGIRAGKVAAFLNKGVRECLTVTLRDGRTLTCTPDHRVLVLRDGASLWVPADQLSLDSDLVVCGLHAPLDDLLLTKTTTTDNNNNPDCWTLPGVDLPPMHTDQDRSRLLAFARLCGLLLTNGSLHWNSSNNCFEANINVGHEMDFESVQADVMLVCGSICNWQFSVSRSQIASSTYSMQVPPPLARMFGAVEGIVVGDRMEQDSRWPAFVLDEKTPLPVLREFVGGIMGGDGHPPCINSGRLDHHVIFSQSCHPQHTETMARKFAQLCTLLTRLGVNGATVHGPTETILNGVASHRYCVQLPSTMGSIDFDEKVGFRHCVHKQARNSAAMVYRRLYNRHLEQRKVFITLVRELRAAGQGRNSAIQQAQDRMRAYTEALDETAIHLSSSGLQKIEASSGGEITRAHPDFPAFETVLREIGAIHMFTTHGVPRGKGISPLLLSVENVRPAGEKEVYDISVPSLGSFTANGIVVHNCDNKFHTEPLNELLQSDDRFGFIIVDGNGVLFGTLSGNTREVIHRMTVDLPKKHGRGGQSALRFARLRLEKRHNYLRKVTELSTQFFITNDRPNVAGLVLAGSADFKTELNASDMFDPRLQTKVVAIVDIAYGGDAGFNQAIELASEVLANVKFIQEKKLITKYFEEISQDTGKYVFGVDETLRALEMGAVETLIVWENLEIVRYTLRNPSTSEVKIIHLNPEQAKDSSHFVDQSTGAQYDVETIPLVEWFANNYRKFGCQLEFITNKSQEGAQFCRGFGGIGGLLRYKVEFEVFVENNDDANDLDLEDFI